MNEGDAIPLTPVGTTENGPEEDVLTIEEAARYLKIGRTTMCALLRTGEVESVTIGRLRRVPLECLKDYVARLRASRAA